jgi:hypothetical protein
LLRSRLAGDDSARAVVLVGNAHAQTRSFSVAGRTINPFGAALVESGIDVLSLNIATAGGEAWLCRSRDACGPTPVNAANGDLGPGIQLNGCEGPCRFHGTFVIESLSVAAPARVAE